MNTDNTNCNACENVTISELKTVSFYEQNIDFNGTNLTAVYESNERGEPTCLAHDSKKCSLILQFIDCYFCSIDLGDHHLTCLVETVKKECAVIDSLEKVKQILKVLDDVLHYENPAVARILNR